MASKITRPVTRETLAREERTLKPYVVTLEPTFIRLRLKGERRDALILSYKDAYIEAAKRAAPTRERRTVNRSIV